MPKKPIIGLSSYDATASWGPWNTRAALVQRTYLDHLIAAGAIPVILPAGIATEDVLDRLDALVVIGGPDIDPVRYGEEAHRMTVIAGMARDDLELALLVGAERRSLPVLAICRGMQMLNVLRGGTLLQHLPEVLGNDEHGPAPGTFGATKVSVDPGTVIHRAIGRDTVVVECAHHQAIDRLGDGLIVTARAADGTVEAIEDPDALFTVGVQWHPEVGNDPALFDAFVTSATPKE